MAIAVFRPMTSPE